MNMEKKDKIDVENINNNNKKNKKDVKNINNNDKKNKKDNIETLNIINLDYVNNRIDKEFCDNTVNELKDTYLINKYKG